MSMPAKECVMFPIRIRREIPGNSGKNGTTEFHHDRVPSTPRTSSSHRIHPRGSAIAVAQRKSYSTSARRPSPNRVTRSRACVDRGAQRLAERRNKLGVNKMKKNKYPRLRSVTRRGRSGQVWVYFRYDMRSEGKPDVQLGKDYGAALNKWERLHNRQPLVNGTVQEAIDR